MKQKVLKSKPEKGRGWWWKILLGVLLLAVVSLGVLFLNINAIALSQINKALNRYLVAGGKLEAVDIHLLEARATFSDLHINPPPGFEPHPLLDLQVFEVDIAPWALLKGRIVVEDLSMKGVSLNVVRDKKGRLSPLDLIVVKAPNKAPGSENEQEDKDSPWFPEVYVNTINAEGLSFRLVDRMLKKDWSAGLRADLAIQGLLLEDLLKLDILVDRLDLKLNDIIVEQPPGFSNAPLLAMNHCELVSQGIDLKSSRLSISDVILYKLSASLERNAEREINLVKLMEAWLPVGEDDNDDAPDPAVSTTAADPPVPAFELPTLVVDNLQLTSVTAQVLDTIEGQTWRAGFDGLDIRVTGVEVGDPTEQDVSLASFDLDLKGIAVDQPPGFGTEKLFSLERFTIISEKPEKTKEELVIKQVSLTGLTSSVTMHADGVTNLQVLNKALLGKDEEAEATREEPTTDEKAPSPAPDLQPVLFEQISLVGGPVTYRDEFFTEETLVASLDNIHLDATDLRLFSKKEGADPASAAISFELAQPGEMPTAYFGALATMGSLGYGVPMVNSQVRLVGLKLDTLGSLVPKATRTALGASGLDSALALAMDADAINLNAAALTDHGIKYKGLKVQGPLEAPVVEPGPIMTGVLGRISDGLVNMGKGGLKSGVDIAEGGVEVVKELGSGTVEVGKNLAKSLFSATAGIVTLDKDKVKEGASGTTKGTVDITKGSVKGSGQAAGGSLKSSASELKGQGRVKAWEEGIPARYQSTMQHAKTVLAEMPYPPVTE